MFDTNVLISALLLPGSVPHQALGVALNKGRILVSFPLLAELNEVLSRKRFRRYIDEDDIREFIAALSRETEWIDVSMRLSACRDAKDNKFLELVVSGSAIHIVTGDRDLLDLNPFQGIPILTPQKFLSQVLSEQ